MDTELLEIPNNSLIPRHYYRGKIVVWDFIRDQNLNFHLGNAIKYICRAGYKTPDAIEDLKKAVVYLQNEINYLESQRNVQ